MIPRRRARTGRASRSFRLVLGATAVSGIGDGLVLAAFPLLAAQLTNEPTLIVAVTVAARLPWLLVALPAGAIIDRGDRRRLVVMVEIGRTAVLAAFAVVVVIDHGVFGALLVAVFLIGVGETVVDSAMHAVLPQLVPPDRLAHANGLLFSTETATENLLGPAIGGVLFAAVAALPFVIDGISFAIAAVLLAVALPAASVAAGRRLDGSGPTWPKGSPISCGRRSCGSSPRSSPCWRSASRSCSARSCCSRWTSSACPTPATASCLG